MFYCPECPGTTCHLYWCERANFVPSPEPLAPWERELLNGRPEGEGDVTFVRFDGRKVVIENVRVDSIGTDGAEPLFNIAVEKSDGTIVHVPFVETWTIDY